MVEAINGITKKANGKKQKTNPELWEIRYAVNKRRAGKAPEGSGVPVGTEYHWYILAHQNVKKIDANNYETSMTGLKLKLAHKRANSEKWSASDDAQKKHLIEFLSGIIEELMSDLAQRGKIKPAKKIEPSKPKRIYRRAQKAPERKRKVA